MLRINFGVVDFVCVIPNECHGVLSVVLLTGLTHQFLLVGAYSAAVIG